MKKNWKSALSLLFVLIFMLQIAGTTAGADFDASVTGGEALSFAVYVPVTDEFGNESSQKLDGVNVTLPEGLSLGLRLGDNELSFSSWLSLGDLMREDLVITPPAGYYVSEAFLCAGDPDSVTERATLEGTAEWPSGEATKITLKHENFIDKDTGYFDVSRLSSAGSEYSLVLRLALLEKVESVTVSYSSGEVYASVPDTVWGSAGESFRVASMTGTAEGKAFTGWRLTYGNGSVYDVSEDSLIQPYASCTLVAQWDDEHSHSYDDGVVTTEPTCTQPGVKTFTCSGCNGTYTEEVAALGHSYTDTVISPTTEAEGYTEHVCSRCGDTYRDSYVEKLQTEHTHSFDDGVVTIEPTCTQPGVKTFTCSGCNGTYTEEVAALGHSYGDGVVTTEPTCTQPGVKTFTCVRGDDSYTEEVAALGHSYGDGVVTTEPTCTQPGVKTFTCVRGDDSYTEEVAALGHSYGDGVVTTEPTCTQPGVKTFTCVRGDDSYTEEIPAKGHEYTETVVAPTLTSDGYTLHECKNCDYSFRDNIVPKLELKTLPAPTLSDSSWLKGSTAGLTLTVDYDFSKLDSVLLNGVKLARDTDYLAREGSTVIELKPETLERQNPGAAKVDVVFTDAKASAEITIEASRGSVKQDLTVRAKDRTAVYSGETITANEYEIVSGSLRDGDTITAEYGGGSVNVTAGAPTMISKLTIKDSGGNDVTSSHYNVTVQNGSVVVSARSLTISGQNVEKVYDGKAFNLQSEYASRISSDKLANHSVSVGLAIYKNGAQVSEAKDAGSYDIMLTTFAMKEGSTDVTANYRFNGTLPAKLGTLTITNAPAAMIPISVTAKSQTWTYDGQTHDCHEYNLSAALQDGDTISVSFDAASTITNVGTAVNKISAVTIKDKNGSGIAFALNGQGSGKYNVTVTDGTLKVDPFKLTLTAVSAEKTYDGTALKNDNVKATALVSGHKFSVVKFAVTDSQGNLIKNGPVSVGTYTKKVTDVTIVDSKNNDVTKNYDITKVDGTLKVLQGNGSNNTKSPKTGDENNMILWIGLLAASALVVLGLAAFLFFKNKKKEAPKAAPEKREPHED